MYLYMYICMYYVVYESSMGSVTRDTHSFPRPRVLHRVANYAYPTHPARRQPLMGVDDPELDLGPGRRSTRTQV